MGRGPIYHGYGIKNTMGRGFNIPWIEDLIYHREGVKIPWVGGSIYHGYWVQCTMCRGLNTMSRGSKCHGKGFKIPWVEDLIFHT